MTDLIALVGQECKCKISECWTANKNAKNIFNWAENMKAAVWLCPRCHALRNHAQDILAALKERDTLREEREILSAKLHGAEARSLILLDAKNMWADKAKELEAENARLLADAMKFAELHAACQVIARLVESSTVEGGTK